MPNTPTAKNHRVNPQAKTSTWNWSFCRSFSSWRIPQSILGSQLDHWGPLDQSHAGHLLLAHQGVRRPIVILWGVRGGSFGKKKLLLACIDGGPLPFSRGRSPTTDVDLYTNGRPCAVTYQSYWKKKKAQYYVIMWKFHILPRQYWWLTLSFSLSRKKIW